MTGENVLDYIRCVYGHVVHKPPQTISAPHYMITDVLASKHNVYVIHCSTAASGLTGLKLPGYACAHPM